MYIVFEGIDGSGKSTQIQMLKEWLVANGFRVETIVEPTDTKLGKLIREILQRPDATSEKIQNALALLFAADRIMIMDELEDESKIIISDRSFISSLAYQGNPEWVSVLNKYAKKPDLLILLDLDVKKSVARTSDDDTFENEEFLTGVKENYLKLAKNYEHQIIDANNGVNKVSSDIKKAVAPYLGLCSDCIR
ncbi:dTMP kinase [Methanobrevibacter sp.]|uniref:dTMP kinase n=1 Tax=Methanobrevibacter sp. TaxID=66852 RepID=UPI00388F5E56